MKNLPCQKRLRTHNCSILPTRLHRHHFFWIKSVTWKQLQVPMMKILSQVIHLQTSCIRQCSQIMILDVRQVKIFRINSIGKFRTVSKNDLQKKKKKKILKTVSGSWPSGLADRVCVRSTLLTQLLHFLLVSIFSHENNFSNKNFFDLHWLALASSYPHPYCLQRPCMQTEMQQLTRQEPSQKSSLLFCCPSEIKNKKILNKKRKDKKIWEILLLFVLIVCQALWVLRVSLNQLVQWNVSVGGKFFLFSFSLHLLGFSDELSEFGLK